MEFSNDINIKILMVEYFFGVNYTQCRNIICPAKLRLGISIGQGLKILFTLYTLLIQVLSVHFILDTHDVFDTPAFLFAVNNSYSSASRGANYWIFFNQHNYYTKIYHI